MKEFLINKYREIMPKKAWHEVKDIYEVVDDKLRVWGNNGRFYLFDYRSDDDWEITMSPYDPEKSKVWHGYGKGWADVSL